MRVIQIVDGLRPGGKERQVVELLKGLAKFRSVESEIIVMSSNVHYTAVYDLGCPIHTLLRRTRKDPSIFITLYKLLKTRRPAILQSWSSMCSVYAIPAVKLLNIKFINGFLRNASPPKYIGNREWIRCKITFPFSDVVVANSQAGLNAYGVPIKNRRCIHNGFDFARLDGIQDPTTVRTQYKIRTEHVVGMVASVSHNKDYDSFIKVAERVLSEREDVTFLAIGDGNKMQETKNKIPSHLTNHIKFLGALEDVESVVQIFSVGVLCTNLKVHGEGISNSIMEYMALQKPVVATKCGGNAELVIDGETGFLVSNNDIPRMAERIRLLLDSVHVRTGMGEAGFIRLRERFSLQRMAAEYVELYRRLIREV